MKKLIILLLATMMCGMTAAKRTKQTQVKWCTFNIRYYTDRDTRRGLGWDTRKGLACQWVKDNNIDVVGMQEVTHRQLEDILLLLPEYDYVGVGRADGKQGGEYSPILFRKNKYKALARGNFWLSETPDVPGSLGWDADQERIASWVKLKDLETGKVFMAVNTHFDHIGTKARVESAHLIMQKIQEIVGKKPAVVTGDFNVTEESPAYAAMVGSEFVMRDAYKMAPEHVGVRYTYQGFSCIAPEKAEKIDFIFVTPQIKVNQTGIEKDNPDAIMSDHNPHWAELAF